MLGQSHVSQRRHQLRDGRRARRRHVAAAAADRHDLLDRLPVGFPNPVAVPAGQPHTLSTHLTRTATNAPVAGWIVRYEVLDGSAVFPPGNATAIEVRTDDNGMGTTTLQPTTNLAGVTQVHIEVIRPADPNSDAPRTKMGEGYTSITWSAPGLAMRASGPPSGAVDSTLVYRVEVQNPGDIVTRGVTVSDVMPPNLQFVSSNPPAQMFGDRAQWQLGDLAPKNMQVIEINVRATAGGPVRYAFQVVECRGPAGRRGRRHTDRAAVAATQRRRPTDGHCRPADPVPHRNHEYRRPGAGQRHDHRSV